MKHLFLLISSVLFFSAKVYAQQVYGTCGNTFVVITATNSGALSNLQYSVEPGGIVVSGPTFTLPAIVGSYTLYATGLTGANQLNTLAYPFSIQTIFPPQISLLANTQPCDATNATISSTISGNGVTNSNVKWLPPAAIFPFANNNIWSFPAPTFSTVLTAVVTDSYGCSSTATAVLNAAKIGHNVSLTFPNGSAIITCAQPSVNVVATPVNPSSPAALKYTYSGASTLPSLPSVFVSVPGNYSLTVLDTVTNCSMGPIPFFVTTNTTALTSTVVPLTQTINCTTGAQSVSLSAGPGFPSCKISVLSPLAAPFSAQTNTVFYVPAAPGIYTTTVMNLNNGCITTKTFQVVSSVSMPSFSLAATQNYTLGCNTKSVVNISFNNAVSSIPGAPIGTAIIAGSQAPTTIPPTNTVSSQITVPGLYTAIVYDIPGGCYVSTPFVINSNVNTPSIYFNQVPVITCTMSSITLQPILQTNTSLLWKFPQGAGTSTQSALQVSGTAASTQSLVGNYTLVVTDNNNACSSSTVIPVLQNKYPPNANFSSGSAPGISCIYPTATLTNISTTGIPGSTGFPTFNPLLAFNWQGPVPQQTLSMSTTYLASIPGVYTLTALDANNGCTATVSKPVADFRDYPAIIQPSSVFVLNCPNATPITIGTSVLGQTTVLTYTWLSSSPIQGPLGTNSITVINPGFYYFTARNTISGCATTVTLAVYECVGFEKEQSDAFAIYPVPCKDVLQIKNVSATDEVKLSISNLQGKLLLSQSITNEQSSMDISSLAPGLYLLVIEGGAGSSVVQKILKE